MEATAPDPLDAQPRSGVMMCALKRGSGAGHSHPRQCTGTHRSMEKWAVLRHLMPAADAMTCRVSGSGLVVRGRPVQAVRAVHSECLALEAPEAARRAARVRRLEQPALRTGQQAAWHQGKPPRGAHAPLRLHVPQVQQLATLDRDARKSRAAVSNISTTPSHRAGDARHHPPDKQ